MLLLIWSTVRKPRRHTTSTNDWRRGGGLSRRFRFYCIPSRIPCWNDDWDTNGFRESQNLATLLASRKREKKRQASIVIRHSSNTCHTVTDTAYIRSSSHTIQAHTWRVRFSSIFSKETKVPTDTPPLQHPQRNRKLLFFGSSFVGWDLSPR
jgi:hypothetical protein